MYDVVIVGAGPGGATSAAFLAKAGLKVLLVDKTAFPRDKICGDAISGKSVNILERLDLAGRMQKIDQMASWGVVFSGPGGDQVEIPFTRSFEKKVPPGYVCAREVFDAMIVEKAVEAGAELWQGATVEALLHQADEAPDRVTGVVVKHQGRRQEVHAPLVVGADGAYSVVARELGMKQLEEKHYVAAARGYYRGVTGFHEAGFIEIHIVKEAIPGYFWLFPMANGLTNVGVGMLSAQIKKRQVRLKPLLEELTQHERFRARFASAEPVGKVRGWGLPLGSKPRRMAGPGWMLVGDAASLIDPFTGEGIGNAMLSGYHAAQWGVKASTAGDFSAAFLMGYERDVLRDLKGELRLSYMIQRVGSWQGLTNMVIRRAARWPAVADVISCMFDELDGETGKLVSSPLFYLRLIPMLFGFGGRARTRQAA